MVYDACLLNFVRRRYLHHLRPAVHAERERKSLQGSHLSGEQPARAGVYQHLHLTTQTQGLQLSQAAGQVQSCGSRRYRS